MANKFAKGFETLEQELRLEQLPVRGAFPDWLTGTLLRNGPAKFEVGRDNYRHWFDGLAMLHRFAVQNGQVSYANRFLRGQDYCQSTESGKISHRQFGTDPASSVFGKIKGVFSPNVTDNASVNITKIANRYVAMTEAPLAVEFDPETLQTLGTFEHGDKFSSMGTTAHPHYDYERQALFNYALHVSRTSSYNIYRINDGSRSRTLVGTVPVKKLAYMHSFAMTQNYIILVEFPLLLNPLSLALGLKTFIESYEWQPQHGTRFLVINKESGLVERTYQAEAFFAFHHINAFEQEGDLLVDLAAHPDKSRIDSFYMDNLRGPDGGNMVESKLRRYRLPAKGSHADYEKLSDEEIELPRINYRRCNTHDYRFAYGTSRRQDRLTDFDNQLVKIDTHERTARQWYEDACYPGEPVFVAAPEAQSEDAGLILSVVLNAAKNNSFLLALEAGSFEEVARAEVPHAIPFGFHGAFFS